MSDSYILEVGEQGKSRLDLMNKFLNPQSQNFLNAIGVTKGMNILEVGCGVGNMTAWLAEQVGPQGQVMAIDISPEQLVIAKKHVKKQGFNNVSFICGDIQTLTNDDNTFDLIYNRFLLLHLTDPLLILNKYQKLIRSKGMIVCEEPIVSDTETFPPSDVWHQIQSLYKALSSIRGYDADFGSSLYTSIENAEFKVHYAAFSQAIITKQETIDYLLKAFSELKESFLDAGLLTELEYMEIINNISSENYQDIQYGTFHKVAHVAATL